MIISIEGNIGAGKTTLLQRLQDALQKMSLEYVIVDEPVEDWMRPIPRQPGGESMFSLYYKDKAKNGFLFQMLALQSRVQQFIEAKERHPNKLIISERCHLTDKEIFAQMLADSQCLTPAERYVYNRWFQTACHVLDKLIVGMIYVRASPSTCVSRIMNRSRDGEQSITLDYIARLHRYHEAWLMGGAAAGLRNGRLCVMDGEPDASEQDLGLLLDFLKSVSPPTSPGVA